MCIRARDGARSVLLGLFLLAYSLSAWGAEPAILVPLTPQQPISWKKNVEIRTEEKDGKISVFGLISGKMLQPDTDLIWNDSPLPLDDGSAFSVEVPLTGKQTELQLISVDALGDPTQNAVEISYPGYAADSAPRLAPSYTFEASAGFSVPFLRSALGAIGDFEELGWIHRIGERASYQRVLKSGSDSNGNAVTESSWSASLPYRFLGEAWNRNPSFAMGPEVRNVAFESTSGTFAGGAVWFGMPFSIRSRSMWLDLNASIYPASLNSGAASGKNVLAGSHLKFFFGQRSYVQLGLNFESFDYKSNTSETSFGVAYFNLGYGIRF